MNGPSTPTLVNINPARTALLVIDMQRDFCAPGGYAEKAGLNVSLLREPIPAISSLLNAARSCGMLVVYTREGHRRDLSDCAPTKMARSHQARAPIGSEGPIGKLLVRGEYGHGIVDELAPKPGEPIVDKPGYGAFYQTDLEIVLRSRGISQLILTGVTTEVCIQSTLREAVDHGFECITVADGCASAYPDLHAASLAMIQVEGGILGRVQTAAELLQSLEYPAASEACQ